MRKICPKCHSNDVTITKTEVICNICDVTVDFKIDGAWAYDCQPCNLLAEARLYNKQYHRLQIMTGLKYQKEIHC